MDKNIVCANFLIGVIVLGALMFFATWCIPSMRSAIAYEQSMDKVFNRASSCWNENYNAGRFIEGNQCYAEWNAWIQVNPGPESGFNWPWYVWKETIPSETNDSFVFPTKEK